jgi:hypothetical protein
MRFHHPFFRMFLAAACWSVLPLGAADGGPNLEFKVRGGLTAGNLSKDFNGNQAFGFAVASRFPLGGARAFTVDLGFDRFPGQEHDAMPGSGPVYYNFQNPVTTYAGESLYLSTANSIDFRKELCQGFSLRGIYSDALPNLDAWYWFAGASLDFYKLRAEMSGTLIPKYGPEPGTVVPGYELVDPANPNGPVKDYYEGWAFVKEKTKPSLGLLAGVGVPFSGDLKFEFTVRNIGATHFDYKPFTYTGTPAVLTESTHRGFVFELAIVVKI